MSVTAPAVLGGLTKIIIGIIIHRHIDWCSSRNIAIIFAFKRMAVIFEMVENIQRPMRGILDQTWPNVLRAEQSRQTASSLNISLMHFRKKKIVFLAKKKILLLAKKIIFLYSMEFH